ncbi:MAG TPA: hypothetical protein VGJ66_18405 [Pyrinomonadaceae bacterium]|jgi:hypothetical protein
MSAVAKANRSASRIVSALVFMFVLAVTTNAYTIVMRGGRRIEIPSRFVVMGSTLTYETAPGIQITLQMAAIDIPATERANNGEPGSLLRRGEEAPESALPTQSPGNDLQSAQTTQARRTITNRDLESTMRRRRESERAYESRRKELGLPSVEESRKRREAESVAIGIELEQRRVAQEESEDYWRGRAADLRTEMAALDAEIEWIRGQLDEGLFSNGWGNGSFSTVTSVTPFTSFGNFGRRPFGNFGGGRHFPGDRMQRPNVFVAPRRDTGRSGRVAFGGLTSFQYARPFGIAGRLPVFPSIGGFGYTIPAYDESYERSALITHFNELSAARAGLNARWRELEQEARRAGAAPGWLRP